MPLGLSLTLFAMGLPISDAYWASVKIEGRVQEVLIQAFERRVLTYAPGLPKGWQVQMGNIGRHYFEWRYGSGDLQRALEPPQRATPAAPPYLSIPSLGVLARIEHVGVDKDNNMDVPSDPFNVAWYKPGTVPGNTSNAIGAGTDAAIQTADVVLMKSDPLDILRAVRLSKATVTKMKQNLFWASIYNVPAILIAAGALYPSLGLSIRPELSALLMSASSIIVAVNAVLLKRVEGDLESVGREAA